MIEELSWYTTKIENMFFSDIHFRVHFGRTYHLSFKESTGYVIYTDQPIRNNAKSAYAMLDDTQLFLKREGSFFTSAFNIYDASTNNCIGEINRKGFIMHEKQYNIIKTKKSIFNKDLPYDMIFEVCKVYDDMLARINIDRVDKKWYKDVYYQQLSGTVDFKDNTTNELILASFFYLHYHIQSYTSS